MLAVKSTSLVRYAVRVMVFLARNDDGGLVADQIACSIGLSCSFFYESVKQVESARLVHSLKGPSGGYCLAKPAKEITLLDVVEAVDGTISGDSSSFSHAAGKILDQRIQKVVDRATEDYRRQLARVRLADLAKVGA